MLLKQEKRTFWWLVSFNLNFPEVYDTEIYFIIAQTFHLLRNSPNALFFDPISCTVAKIINVKTTVRRKKTHKNRLKLLKRTEIITVFISLKNTLRAGEDNTCTQISVEATIGTWESSSTERTLLNVTLMQLCLQIFWKQEVSQIICSLKHVSGKAWEVKS